jgi:hypothetical protein
MYNTVHVLYSMIVLVVLETATSGALPLVAEWAAAARMDSDFT